MTTLLLFGDTESSPAMRHEVPLAIGDSFMFADIDGRRAVLTSSLERSRIAAILPDAELLDFTALGMRELIEQGHSRLEAQGEIAVRAVAQLEITAAVIPWDFPVAIADRLRAGGIQLTVDDEFVADGNLWLDGEVLLAEDLRDILRRVAAEHGATCPAEMMVASVRTGFGHDPGSGPLPAGLPTCDLFEAAGYATQRTGDPDNTNESFQFALGHGVGLEVHEPPGLGLSGQEPFVAGDVVAIEPGLWDVRIGGVRFEDLLLVTDDGSETLTRFSYALSPGS